MKRRRPVGRGVAGVEVGVVDLDLAQPHLDARAGRERRPARGPLDQRSQSVSGSADRRRFEPVDAASEPVAELAGAGAGSSSMSPSRASAQAYIGQPLARARQPLERPGGALGVAGPGGRRRARGSSRAAGRARASVGSRARRRLQAASGGVDQLGQTVLGSVMGNSQPGPPPARQTNTCSNCRSDVLSIEQTTRPP